MVLLDIMLPFNFLYLFEEAGGFYANCVDHLLQIASFGNHQDGDSQKMIHFRLSDNQKE